jgi:hypothetical protein
MSNQFEGIISYFYGMEKIIAILVVLVVTPQKKKKRNLNR